MNRWAYAMEDELRRLWNKEGKTARECAEELGVTRNAVIGKVHRLGLARRASPILAKMEEEKRRKRRAEAQRRYKDSHKRPPAPRAPKSNLPRVAAPRVASRVVALPSSGGNDAALIAGWLAQNGGPRKFERAATGDPTMMALWLRARGYQVALSIASGRTIKIVDPGGNRTSLSLRELVDLVDALRIREGLEPTIAREAA